MLKRLLTKLFKYDPIDDGEYMERWHIIGDRDTADRWRMRLHNIRRSDAGRELHDHPWDYTTIVLWGGYWEVTEATPEEFLTDDHAEIDFDVIQGAFYRRRWYSAGSILCRKAAARHRIEIPRGKSAWTLFMTSKKSRDWGFWSSTGKFTPWKEYERKA